MARKRRKRRSVRLTLTAAALLAAAAGILLLSWKFQFLENPFVSKKTEIHSEAVLKKIADIGRLDTVEFIHRLVFPYDLLSSDVDIGRLPQRFKEGAALSSEEIEALSVISIAADAGLSLENDNYSFTVLTVKVRAGYDFSMLNGCRMEKSESGDTISISLPEAEISEIIIEDLHSGNYGFPDMNISPERWEKLTTALRPIIIDEAEKRGLTEKAAVNGRRMIETVLLASGYSGVVFE